MSGGWGETTEGSNMGAYDEIVVGERVAQVKLWDNQLTHYTLGDEVPNVGEGITTYSVAVREGGFVNVNDGRIESWTDIPKHVVVLDKWGAMFDPDGTRGIMNEPYFHHR